MFICCTVKEPPGNSINGEDKCRVFVYESFKVIERAYDGMGFESYDDEVLRRELILVAYGVNGNGLGLAVLSVFET